MKPMCSLFLSLLLASQSVLYAQSDARAWAQVMATPPGSPVFVAVAAARERRVYFVSADEDTLVVLDPAGATLSPRAERFMTQIAKTHPEYLTTSTGEFVTGDFRFTPAGLFQRGKLIAGHSDVVRTVPKAEVRALQPAPEVSEGFSGPTHAAITAGIFFGVPFLFFVIACARGCK